VSARALVLLLLATAGPACYGWRAEPPAPEDLIRTRHPSLVRLTTRDGRRILVANPRMLGDTVHGWQSSPRGPLVDVPLAAIQLAEARYLHAARTTGVVLGAGTVLVTVLGVLVMTSVGPNY